MPEVKMTEQQLNYHVNNNPMTEKRPLTECAHEAPYGPGHNFSWLRDAPGPFLIGGNYE